MGKKYLKQLRECQQTAFTGCFVPRAVLPICEKWKDLCTRWTSLLPVHLTSCAHGGADKHPVGAECSAEFPTWYFWLPLGKFRMIATVNMSQIFFSLTQSLSLCTESSCQVEHCSKGSNELFGNLLLRSYI